jgi:integrase
MANQLPSGKWRGRVRHPRTGKQIAPHTVIGGPTTYPTRRAAERAEDDARLALLDLAEHGVTVIEWWIEWTTSPLWSRPAESTNIYNRDRTRKFAQKYADRPIRSIDHHVVAEWLKGGQNRPSVDALRVCFNDARRPQAGMLVDRNPFAGLGLKRSKGRKEMQPPGQGEIARMNALADELTPPSFAAWLHTACWSAARPGELDALQWTDLDFQAEEIRIERQWNAHTRTITPPKHESRRTIAMTEPVRARLLDLPRESEFVFTTIRQTHYTPSSRCFHWNRVRAAAGMGNVPLYLATRHWFGWYALNVLDLPPHQIALQLGHQDGGRLVRELYGHPDAAIARERLREAVRSMPRIAALPIAAATAA